LDEQIVGLLLNRLSLVHQVREFKLIDGVPQHTPEREQVVISNVTSECSGLEKEYVQAVYTALLDATRIVADKKQVLL
jgi:chorismate mutase